MKRYPTPSSQSSTSRHKRRRRSSSSSSAGSADEADNKSDAMDGPLKVYIVQAKLSEQTISELYELIDSTRESGGAEQEPHLDLEICTRVEDADIILTGIQMRKRLERHVNWKIACQKSIVTPDWLRVSVKQNSPAECGKYAAITELHDETVENCPDEDCVHCKSSEPPASHASSSSSPPAYTIPIVKPTPEKVFKNWKSRYACTRASPLVCINQGLAAELGILGRSRELEGLGINALAYERAVAVIKSYPYKITEETFERDIAHLPGLGSKTLSKISEYLENGYIQEAKMTRNDERFQALSAFASIYGIGPSNARRLYDIGLRTFEDLERYYDLTPGATVESLALEAESQFTPNGKKISTMMDKNKLPELSVKVSLALRNELDFGIPREEVEEIHKVVMQELDEVQPGCVSTVVGGYRRGKPKSNDVDIVISHSDLEKGADLIKGLCKRFARHLHARGHVTHVMHLSGFHAHDALREGHWDSLEKALTVFKFPLETVENSGGRRSKMHRRLDLIFAVPQAYWTAVVGWSGSKMFERDLRLWAKAEKGLKFDSSGLTRRHDSKLFIPRSEQDVFDILGLDWVDPTMRNADV
ncbi:hypothetical protein D9613_000864 [Agrocybe pediades]|uniref:DNA-directed DNA polymerase n=1 Tax=Agrocybe pediades TaxID=84607 RepID=A0A8H4R3A1_9AGAR|nr:hypothetical protein D9613_000864 [Agrocybe pediades]